MKEAITTIARLIGMAMVPLLFLLMVILMFFGFFKFLDYLASILL